MTHRRDVTTDAGRTRFITALAEDPETVLAAQRLRARVFKGGNASGDASGAIDRDEFDAHCEHLVVRDRGSGDVVGTYRILTAERARAAGRFYSETEFDCGRLHRLPGRLVEVGRACVDPAHRGGSVIALLLAGLTRYVVARGYDYVIGCASIDVGRGVAEAAEQLCRRLVREHLGPDEWRVVPHVPFRPGPTPDGRDASSDADWPPLIKAYLRFGASVCGEPAWDPEFQTADVLMLLPMATMNPRFRARLLRGDGDPPRRRSSRWAA
jgi:putative hemolysin